MKCIPYIAVIFVSLMTTILLFDGVDYTDYRPIFNEMINQIPDLSKFRNQKDVNETIT